MIDLHFIQFEACRSEEGINLYGLDEDFQLWVRLANEEFWQKIPMLALPDREEK